MTNRSFAYRQAIAAPPPGFVGACAAAIGAFPPAANLVCRLRELSAPRTAGWAEIILFDRRTEERRIFNPLFVRSLWARHLAGHEHWTLGKIAPLITLEVVLREWFD